MCTVFQFWRRGRDSNPRRCYPHSISSRALSTSQPPLHIQLLYHAPTDNAIISRRCSSYRSSTPCGPFVSCDALTKRLARSCERALARSHLTRFRVERFRPLSHPSIFSCCTTHPRITPLYLEGVLLTEAVHLVDLLFRAMHSQNVSQGLANVLWHVLTSLDFESSAFDLSPFLQNLSTHRTYCFVYSQSVSVSLAGVLWHFLTLRMSLYSNSSSGFRNRIQYAVPDTKSSVSCISVVHKHTHTKARLAGFCVLVCQTFIAGH